MIGHQDWPGLGFSKSSRKLILNIPGARHKECAGFSDQELPTEPYLASRRSLQAHSPFSWEKGLDWAKGRGVGGTQELEGLGVETQLPRRLKLVGECCCAPVSSAIIYSV